MPLLNQFSSFLDSEEVKSFIAEITGNGTFEGKTTTSARLFGKYDFTTAHNNIPKIAKKKKWGETDDDSEESEKLSDIELKHQNDVTYVVTLTKEWDEKYGGDTVVVNGQNVHYHIPPR